ncbi:MAG: PKD domain-containing protein [Lewinellaceae bacterium]|nr:PKD domain-containing protein [Lewinellaceae bacterium]
MPTPSACFGNADPHGRPAHFAHYRLGPVDGSSCDSLGIDNIPWAWWRYKQDTALYGTIYFTDLSAYEPTEWHWDFGDGAFSSDTSPVHGYAAPGTYTVCLTVSNAFGADTLCRTIHIATVPAHTAQYSAC